MTTTPALPEGLPPLPPNSRYAGQLKDHDGDVYGWTLRLDRDTPKWQGDGKSRWAGMCGSDRSSADWHLAVPLDTPEIRSKPMGEHAVATDGTRSCIGKDEAHARQGVEERQRLSRPTPETDACYVRAGMMLAAQVDELDKCCRELECRALAAEAKVAELEAEIQGLHEDAAGASL